MLIYVPVEYFRIRRSELEQLCRDVLKIWPERIIFNGKEFGSLEEYKCETFTAAYKAADERMEVTDFGEWSELAPIVFDFVARAIKHASFYLNFVETQQVDVSPIVKDMGAREDIQIEDGV